MFPAHPWNISVLYLSKPWNILSSRVSLKSESIILKNIWNPHTHTQEMIFYYEVKNRLVQIGQECICIVPCFSPIMILSFLLTHAVLHCSISWTSVEFASSTFLLPSLVTAPNFPLKKNPSVNYRNSYSLGGSTPFISEFLASFKPKWIGLGYGQVLSN